MASPKIHPKREIIFHRQERCLRCMEGVQETESGVGVGGIHLTDYDPNMPDRLHMHTWVKRESRELVQG